MTTEEARQQREQELARELEYWAARTALSLSRIDATEAEIMEKVGKAYRAAEREILKRVKAFYAEYMQDYGVSYAEAVKRLTRPQMVDWEEGYKALIDEVQEHAEGWELAARELREQSLSVRIPRGEALAKEIAAVATQAEAGTYTASIKGLSDTLADEFLHAAFDSQSLSGQFREVGALGDKAIELALNHPWSGKSFSERLWSDRNRLVYNLEEAITQGLIRGDGVDAISKALHDKLGGSFKNVRRLVATELTYVQNQGKLMEMREDGIWDAYRFLAHLDQRTCEVCGALDLKTFPLDEATPGLNMPPMHPYCRCAIVPVIAGEEIHRYARTEDGREEVPEGMGFEEWKKRYVDGSYTHDARGRKIRIVGKSVTHSVPNSITQVVSKRGGITRNYYGEDGKQVKQISDNDHGHPAESGFGNHGEHAHNYSWDEGGRVRRSKARELYAEEREENGDIL